VFKEKRIDKMSFEEEFPELAGVKCECWGCGEYGDRCKPPSAISADDMIKYCLSKQRVKEIIIRVCEEGYKKLKDEGYTDEDSVYGAESFKDDLFNKLGLENEK